MVATQQTSTTENSSGESVQGAIAASASIYGYGLSAVTFCRMYDGKRNLYIAIGY